MKGYATYQLAKIRQHELIAAADQVRRVKEARPASRGTAVPARRPPIWLREAAGGIAARLMTVKGAPERTIMWLSSAVVRTRAQL